MAEGEESVSPSGGLGQLPPRRSHFRPRSVERGRRAPLGARTRWLLSVHAAELHPGAAVVLLSPVPSSSRLLSPSAARATASATAGATRRSNTALASRNGLDMIRLDDSCSQRARPLSLRRNRCRTRVKRSPWNTSRDQRRTLLIGFGYSRSGPCDDGHESSSILLPFHLRGRDSPLRTRSPSSAIDRIPATLTAVWSRKTDVNVAPTKGLCWLQDGAGGRDQPGWIRGVGRRGARGRGRHIGLSAPGAVSVDGSGRWRMTPSCSQWPIRRLRWNRRRSRSSLPWSGWPLRLSEPDRQCPRVSRHLPWSA